MKNLNNQAHYTSVITSLVNAAALHTEGVSSNEVLLRKSKKLFSPGGNVNVYFEGKKVTVDVYIDVLFGYNVAQVACVLQEKIIKDVTDNSDLIVKNVNIIVNGVIFN